MNAFFTKIAAVLTSIITMLTAVFCPPAPVLPEFNKPTEQAKTYFDEGEFIMGNNDLVVSPDGNDNNPGTVDAPLKTLERAKEILKAEKNSNNKAVTVWFREGTYFIEDTVEFTVEDRSNVLYRSYPDEDVVFSGSKEISGNWSETAINGVKAFVTDMPVESDDDYFRSLFKDGTRLSRSNYPKTGVFKVSGEPLDDESIPSSHAPDFFTHALAFYVNKNDIIDFENPNDIDVRIMHFWRDDVLPIYSVNTETGRIQVTKPSAMRIRVDDNYIYENVK